MELHIYLDKLEEMILQDHPEAVIKKFIMEAQKERLERLHSVMKGLSNKASSCCEAAVMNETCLSCREHCDEIDIVECTICNKVDCTCDDDYEQMKDNQE